IKQFEPGFTLNEVAESIDKLEDGTFIVTTNKGTRHHGKAVAIAGGLGSFEPRKPVLDNLSFYEDKGIEYFVKNPEQFRDKNVVIAGGGDSALTGRFIWLILPKILRLFTDETSSEVLWIQL